jgi:hypothetical protein
MADQEDDDVEDDPGAPPEADTVALRALAAAGLLRRLALERSKAPPEAHAPLRMWLEENGLLSNFGAEGFELFDAEPGSWSEEDLETVGWGAEELAVLAWALGAAEPPPLGKRADPAPLLAAFPSEGPAEPFSLAAKVKPVDALETQQALYSTLAMAARTEVWARAIADEPKLAEGDEDLEAFLEAAEVEGFPLAKLTEEKGVAGAAIECLRSISQKLVEEIFGAGSPHKAVAFSPGALATMDEETLGTFLATTQLREQALAWLTEGDAWEDDGKS